MTTGRFRWEHGNAVCECGHLAGTHPSSVARATRAAGADRCGVTLPGHEDATCPCPRSSDGVMEETAERLGPERWPDRDARTVEWFTRELAGWTFNMRRIPGSPTLSIEAELRDGRGDVVERALGRAPFVLRILEAGLRKHLRVTPEEVEAVEAAFAAAAEAASG